MSDEEGLRRYRDKRTADDTREPFGGTLAAASTRLGAFVVQKHDARRTHYDFRLELDGVLLSWALPKSPTMDPSRKCLAVRVENHPLDYAGFEGVIPAGNYGAGAVIVWDRGCWIPDGDPRAGLKNGELKFELRGYKLRGRYTLVHTKRPRSRDGDNHWLLIKKQDAYSDAVDEVSEYSVISGQRVEDLRDGSERYRELLTEIAAHSEVTRQPVDPSALRPMLAKLYEGPFDDPAWFFELKYDGYRLLAARCGADAELRYRSGRTCSELYPEIRDSMAAFPVDDTIFDGEVVVFGGDGRSQFHLLQQRSGLSRVAAIRRAQLQLPASMVVFDVVCVAGLDLRRVPLVQRKAWLQRLLPPVGPLRYCEHIDGNGRAFYNKVVGLHLEGVVAKRKASRYLEERNDDWRKIKVELEDDFAVAGYSDSKSDRTGFGALLLVARRDNDWVYAGRVGSGFTESQLVMVREQLDQLDAWNPSFRDELPRDYHWLRPELVCRVKYREWRDGGHLRNPVFVGMRDDLSIADIHPRVEEDEPTALAPIKTEKRILSLTNLGKVFWPDAGYTKGHLVDYYRAIGPHLLPYLRDRPVVLTRYPDGITGKRFFQKDAPTWVPSWIRTELVWSQHAEREIHYFVCDDVDVLVYLANLGTIPLHIWSSRTESLAEPDWLILDLDPKGAPFADVVSCAHAIRELCEEIDVPHFVKTSGSAGLHIIVPITGATYAQSRNLAHLLARIIETRHGDIATTVRSLEKRDGKVYLDWGQNGHGRLLVAPYSVRALPGAPVSMPIEWAEVTEALDVRGHTVVNAIEHITARPVDPMAELLRCRVPVRDLIVQLEPIARGLPR